MCCFQHVVVIIVIVIVDLIKIDQCDYPVKSFGDGEATGRAKYILSFVEHSD